MEIRFAITALCLLSTTLVGQSFSQEQIFIESEFSGAGSVGSQEPLFDYDDQEPWKHGYIKVMPFYHGFHSFRPYNYHHVFGQSTTAQGFGMSPVMPYSQQFWHRYERMADLSQGNHEPIIPNEPPPKRHNHLPRPINNQQDVQPIPNNSAPPAPPASIQGGQPYYTSQQQSPQTSDPFLLQVQPRPIAPVQFENAPPPPPAGPSLPGLN